MNKSNNDPIWLLRDSFTHKRDIKIKKKSLKFSNDIELPLQTPTAWLSLDGKKKYNIGDLWLFLRCK